MILSFHCQSQSKENKVTESESRGYDRDFTGSFWTWKGSASLIVRNYILGRFSKDNATALTMSRAPVETEENWAKNTVDFAVI